MKRAAVCTAGWVTWLLFLGASLAGAQVITTFAGTWWNFRGNGKPAVNAPLGILQGVAVDSAGNVFAGGPDDNMVVRISPDGVLKIAAGNGFWAYSGDGGPAVDAAMYAPGGLALDTAGNLYIADTNNFVVRKVSPSGTITTVAGNGTQGNGGDGGPATSAQLMTPWALATDSSGTLYIADIEAHRIRKVTAGGTISAVAGSGATGYSGDGGPATAASFCDVRGLAADNSGNVYVADACNDRIRKIDRFGVITTFAGGGSTEPGDGLPATSAYLAAPTGVALDAAGNLYIVEQYGFVIRKVNTSGVITTVAGSRRNEGFSGDGGPALSARFSKAEAIAVDSAGNLYLADTNNKRVRKIAAGIVTTIAGNGLYKYAGDGGPATSASFNLPFDVAQGPGGAVYIADTGNHSVRKVDSAGIVSTVAGTGFGMFSGDNGPATSANLYEPSGVALDSTGNIYIADRYNFRVRRVNTAGVITTFAGQQESGFSGDGGPATSARLSQPVDVALDTKGNLYIVDFWNHRVRKVTTDGTITTFAGSGPAEQEHGGFSGDGGPAAAAMLNRPASVVADTAGNLFIADMDNHRVRRVDASGIITTFAGNGTAGYAGDGGPATQAALNRPAGLDVDAKGNLYIADTVNNRIRVVNTSGLISTVAGGGGILDDGVKATDADLWLDSGSHSGLLVDTKGNLLIAVPYVDRIRAVLATAPALSVTPLRVSVSLASGDSADLSQPITVNASVLGVPWIATATTQTGGNWLDISPTSGEAPGSITISVDAGSLSPGTYQGTVTVQAPLAAPSSQAVAIELTVTSALPPQLAVEPGSVTLEAAAGGANPPGQTLRIGNAGGGTLDWTARAETASGGNWLAISPASGSSTGGTPASAQATMNLSGLATGTYSGAIVVTSGEQSIRVAVTLLVTAATKTILVSQSGLLFTGVQGGSAVPSHTLGVLNAGQGTMDWTMEAATLSGGNWLTVTPSTGRSDATSTDVPLIEVAANTTGLAAGKYSGVLRVRSSLANNSPQLVSVELNVLTAGSNPGVEVRPSGLIFATRAGSSSPGSQTVRLATAAPGTLEARAGVLTLDGASWLKILPQDALLSPGDPRTITVQPALGKLAAGIYRGGISFLFGDGSLQAVNVLFLVVRTTSTSGAYSLLGDQAAFADGTCMPARLLAMHRTLGTGFVAPVGSPKLIEVQVADDCGAAVTNATVLASFSNGDPPLLLTRLPNGLYVGTWRPVLATAQVTVTARATLPPLQAAEAQVQGQISASSSVPQLFAGGIVNAASYAGAGGLAPGAIVAAFGRSMASGLNIAQTVPLATSLGGATLNIGGIDTPLFFSSDGQINAQLPFDLTPNSRPQAYVKVRLQAGGPELISVPEPITIGAAQPGIFSMNQTGAGQGAILDVNWKLVDASNPVKSGEYVQIFATGLGLVNCTVPAGQAAPTDRLCSTTVPVEVTIGGKTATVSFAGLAPGFVGLYQVNATVPAGVTPGTAVPLVITQSGIASNTVTLAVQ